MNNEVKDDLLNAFENPDMIVQEPVMQNAFVQEPVTQQPVMPDMANQVEPVMQNAFVQEPVTQQPAMPDMANQVEPVMQNAFVQEPVTQQPVMQNTFVQEQNNSSVIVQEIDNKKSTEGDDSLKKNMIFVGVLFAIILVFIFFLPKIISIINNF